MIAIASPSADTDEFPRHSKQVVLKASAKSFTPSWKPQTLAEATVQAFSAPTAKKEEDGNIEVSTQSSSISPARPDTLATPVSAFRAAVKKPPRKFSNEEERQQFVEDYSRKFKTELCKNWMAFGSCEFGDKCSFAHGKDQLSVKKHVPENYKTKPCRTYSEGKACPYGDRCRFMHIDLTKTSHWDMLKENTKQAETRLLATGEAALTNYFPKKFKPLSVFKRLRAQ